MKRRPGCSRTFRSHEEVREVGEVKEVSVSSNEGLNFESVQPITGGPDCHSRPGLE